ncbi:rhodanese-like domain-containing protein [Sulfuriroseicoccus oceanibius]|uniref:Rhodanese-like domain-containing protein n=1 Tax=Sulfuriroseicoccus oceanibius TaxID=2707525 RepID=A0A6B3LDF8_9BACT|nr:rhodanese-like domain-containing protein [Sulfuriroseicoccus oceanibius]QQL45138.1 rhodanese-like domain-containing protein [Sulfuriroseicoccus oceanibius]
MDTTRLFAALGSALVLLVVSACEHASMPSDDDLFAAAVDAPAPVWIDLRTEAQYRSGHLPEAVNIPVDQLETTGDLQIALAQAIPDPTARINLYCRTGRKSGMVFELMRDFGCRDVVDHGGYKNVMR